MHASVRSRANVCDACAHVCAVQEFGTAEQDALRRDLTMNRCAHCTPHCPSNDNAVHPLWPRTLPSNDAAKIQLCIHLHSSLRTYQLCNTACVYSAICCYFQQFSSNHVRVLVSTFGSRAYERLLFPPCTCHFALQSLLQHHYRRHRGFHWPW